MKRLLDYGRTVELLPPLDNGMIGRFNPSIIYKDGKFTITVRESSYTLFEQQNNGYSAAFNGSKRWFNSLYITECESPFSELEWSKVNFKNRKVDTINKFRGIEDVRLIDWDDKLYYSAARKDWTDTPDTKLEEGILSNNATSDERKLPSRNKTEKNYVPIEGMPNTYIWQISPTILLKDNEFVTINNNVNFNNHRGSTQAIKYKDGYIAITHTKTGSSFYSHHFVLFDKDLQITSVSEPFSFDRQPIEFTCGICLVGDKFYISYATMDRRAFVLKVETSVLDKLEFENMNTENATEDTRFDSREHLVLVQYKYNENSKEIVSAVNSFKKHAQFKFKMFLLGDKCPWLEVPVIEGDKEDLGKYPCREQHIHVARDLKNVITIFKDSYDEFCLMSDDFFCINDFTWEDLQVPKYNTKRIDAFGTNKKYWNYSKMKTNQFLIKNHISTIDYTTHCFAVYEMNKLEKIIDDYNLTTPCNDYTIEDLYGNLYWTNAVDVNRYRTRFRKNQHVHIGMVEEAKKQGKLFMNFADGVDLRLLPYVDKC